MNIIGVNYVISINFNLILLQNLKHITMSPFIFISSQIDGSYDAIERNNRTERFTPAVAEQLSEYWVG